VNDDAPPKSQETLYVSSGSSGSATFPNFI